MDRRHALIAALSVVALGGVSIAGCGRRRTPVAVTPSAEPPNLLYPSAAAGLFHPGTRHRLEGGKTAVAEVLPAGSLRLPTGRLVAVDPSWLSGRRRPPGIGPFTVTVPPGTYPLELALLRWEDLRVAAARLTVADKPVTAWEMAVHDGQNHATLRPGYFFGVGVDVATIAVFDAAALDEVGRIQDADPTAFDVRHADRPVTRADVVPGVNAIAFTTGWGDGSYPVWIGRTRDGGVGCFILDMLMLAPSTASTTATPWSPPTTDLTPPRPSSTG
jgi:hypothetical protein